MPAGNSHAGRYIRRAMSRRINAASGNRDGHGRHHLEANAVPAFFLHLINNSLVEGFVRYLATRVGDQQQTIANLITVDSEHRLGETLLCSRTSSAGPILSAHVLSTRLPTKSSQKWWAPHDRASPRLCLNFVLSGSLKSPRNTFYHQGKQADLTIWVGRLTCAFIADLKILSPNCPILNRHNIGA